MVQFVRKKSIFDNSDVFRLVMSMRSEKISASFTRSPRFYSVELSKGGGKQCALLFRIKEARKPQKVVAGGEGSECAMTSRGGQAVETMDGAISARHLRAHDAEPAPLARKGRIGKDDVCTRHAFRVRGKARKLVAPVTSADPVQGGQQHGPRQNFVSYPTDPTVDYYARVRAFHSSIPPNTASSVVFSYELRCPLSQMSLPNPTTTTTEERPTQRMPLLRDH